MNDPRDQVLVSLRILSVDRTPAAITDTLQLQPDRALERGAEVAVPGVGVFPLARHMWLLREKASVDGLSASIRRMLDAVGSAPGFAEVQRSSDVDVHVRVHPGPRLQTIELPAEVVRLMADLNVALVIEVASFAQSGFHAE